MISKESVIKLRSQMEPVDYWMDGTRVEMCQVLAHKADRRTTLVVSLLGKHIVGRGGTEYVSWGVNDVMFRNIADAPNERIYFMLEMERHERWQQILAEGRMLDRNEFKSLVQTYGYRKKDWDYRVVSDLSLDTFKSHPHGHPDRQLWLR